MNNIDIFTRIENLATKGIIIDVVAINQIENGYGERVEAGDMPLITYTVEVMDTSLGNMLYTESCNTLRETLGVGVKWAGMYNREKDLI